MTAVRQGEEGKAGEGVDDAIARAFSIDIAGECMRVAVRRRALLLLLLLQSSRREAQRVLRMHANAAASVSHRSSHAQLMLDLTALI